MGEGKCRKAEMLLAELEAGGRILPFYAVGGRNQREHCSRKRPELWCLDWPEMVPIPEGKSIHMLCNLKEQEKVTVGFGKCVAQP